MEEKIIEQSNLEPEQSSQEGSITQEDSMLGKFKDAKTLLDAYNSLQAEFTRKSQKLAEFQKENERNAIFQQPENIDEILKDETTDKEKYKKEITEIVSKLQFDNLPNKYQVAFNIAKTIEQKVAENLKANNIVPYVVETYLKSNTGVKNDIITEYLSTLNNISLAPTVVAENPSTIHFSNLNSNPKTLKEAGEIFSKMLK